MKMCAYYQWYWVGFGVFSAVGGLIGFLKANSKASLIAGLASGLLLGLAFVLVSQGHAALGNGIGLVLSLALGGRFAAAYRRDPKPFPAIPMILLGAGGVLTGICAFLLK